MSAKGARRSKAKAKRAAAKQDRKGAANTPAARRRRPVNAPETTSFDPTNLMRENFLGIDRV